MTTTNSRLHITERAIVGALGATLVVGPAMLNWIDSVDVQNVSKLAPFAFGGVLLIAWAYAVYVAAKDPDVHFGCFLKGVGVPGTVSSLFAVAQIAVPT